jgi:hypothetical protein
MKVKKKMNTNENEKKEVVNEQKNLIAKSVKELEEYFDNANMYFEMQYPSYEIEYLPTNDKHIIIATDEYLTPRELNEHKSHKFTSVKLISITISKNWIDFDYEILN